MAQESIKFTDDWNHSIIKENTKCKHDAGYGCDKCGTSQRRDVKHKTINGDGEIARLRINKKK